MFLCPRTAVFPVRLGPLLLVPQERVGDLRCERRRGVRAEKEGKEERKGKGEEKRGGGKEEEEAERGGGGQLDLLKTGSLCSSIDDSWILSMID